MNTNSKKVLVLILVVLIVGVVFGLGVEVGQSRVSGSEKVSTVFNKDTGKPSAVDFEPFWKAWSIIDEKYVNGANGSSTEEKVSDEERVFGAISGMVKSLGDPYTVFLPPEEKKSFEEDVKGTFGGVGMEIGIRESVLTVISAIPSTPAERAGIQSGDKIIQIDGESTLDMSVDEAVRKIRGDVGTSVTLTIKRLDQKELFDLNVVRGLVSIPTIKTELRSDRVFVIKLYNFSAQSRGLFREALKEFINAKTDKLVLDLRGNPGGYLSAAIDISSWFLPSGKIVLRELRTDTGEGEEEVYRSSGYNIFNDKLKMVILVDGGSASASEIVAGALGEHDVATIIGEKTFGKGSVQELVPLTDDTSLKITIAKWLTPKGHSFSDNGLDPDVVVLRTREDVLNNRDPQMDRAVEFLLSLSQQN